jgi:predicted  nucleic acid-binding Zn-ribbon protein
VTKASAEQQRVLLRLQQIDTDIRRLQHRRANLPEQQTLDDRSALLDKVNADHLAARDELVAVDRRQKRLEHDVSAVDSRRRAEEGRMYSGAIVTEREVEALRSELSSLKTRKRDLEDELLEAMERHEELTATVSTLEERRVELRAEVAPLQQARDAAAADIDAELGDQEAARQEVVADLTPGVVAAYDRLRARKDGVAVAELRNNTCQGCHLQLTAGELEEGREIGELGLARCVQCGRLLVEPAEE